MSVEIADVADALVAFLADQTFAAPYDAPLQPERVYDPEYTPSQLSKLKVSVVGFDWTWDLADSDDDDEEVMVAVCVQKHTDRSLRDMDELCKLARDIARRCGRADLDTIGVSATRVTFGSSPTFPLYDPQKLNEEGIFWSAILVTFRVMEAGEEDE